MPLPLGEAARRRARAFPRHPTPRTPRPTRSALASEDVLADELDPRKLSTSELVAQKPAPDEFARAPRHPIFVVCDNVRSLANVGLIFRLCDAARVERLYLCGITGYPAAPGDARPPWVAERANHVIAKTAIHTVPYVPWEYRPDATDVVWELKRRGAQIVTLEQTTESVDYTCAPYRFPLCLIVGHERLGVADPILALADLVVAIPLYGIGNSLNVATAVGICLYELIGHYLRTAPCR